MSLLNRIRNTLDIMHGFDELPETEEQTLQAEIESAILKTKLKELSGLAIERVPGTCVQAVLYYSGFSPELKQAVSELVKVAAKLSPEIKKMVNSKAPKQ